MKINSINNNYQKPQSFGATANLALIEELKSALKLTSTPQELVAFFREEKKLAAQVPPQDFASRFRAIKAIGLQGKEVDPHVRAGSLSGSPESAAIYFNVKLPDKNGDFSTRILKTKNESPRAFVDKFLRRVQDIANDIQNSEDVEKAADAGMDAFLKGL